jgi:hypothetical protein
MVRLGLFTQLAAEQKETTRLLEETARLSTENESLRRAHSRREYEVDQWRTGYFEVLGKLQRYEQPVHPPAYQS